MSSLNEPTTAEAILDRLTASAHRVELLGKSLRRKKKLTNIEIMKRSLNDISMQTLVNFHAE